MLKRKHSLDEKIPDVPSCRRLSLSSKDTEVAVVKEGYHVGKEEKIPCNSSNKLQKGNYFLKVFSFWFHDFILFFVIDYLP